VSERPKLDYATPPPRGPHPIEKGLKVLLSAIIIAVLLLFAGVLLAGFVSALLH
jgi:hypothetical protein